MNLHAFVTKYRRKDQARQHSLNNGVSQNVVLDKNK